MTDLSPALSKEGEEAVRWMTRLSLREPTQRDIRGFEDWLGRSEANRVVWAKLERAVGPLSLAFRYQGREGALAEQALKSPLNRRKVMTGIAGFGLLGGAGAALNRFVPLDDLMADKFTMTGQSETVALSDGSTLTLGPRTAIDIDFSPTKRSIRLRDGHILLRARRDPSDAVRIEVGKLTLRSVGGLYETSLLEGIAYATAVDTPATVECRDRGSVTLPAGQCISFDGAELVQRRASVSESTAWIEGMLVIESQPLSFVVARLRPYFAGVITLDPSIAGLLVTGVFPLTDLNRALDTIAAALDVAVQRMPFWVSISPASVHS